MARSTAGSGSKSTRSQSVEAFGFWESGENGSFLPGVYLRFPLRCSTSSLEKGYAAADTCTPGCCRAQGEGGVGPGLPTGGHTSFRRSLDEMQGPKEDLGLPICKMGWACLFCWELSPGSDPLGPHTGRRETAFHKLGLGTRHRVPSHRYHPHVGRGTTGQWWSQKMKRRVSPRHETLKAYL